MTLPLSQAALTARPDGHSVAADPVGPPADPLAASGGAQWAVARQQAVQAVPLDGRGEALAAALSQLAAWLDGQGEGAARMVQAQLDPAVSRRQPTEEFPASHVLQALADGAPDLPPDELPEEAAEAIELAPDEVAEALAAEEEVQRVEPSSGGSGGRRHQLAAAETIVLSGPEIRRKIRHKQSIMPSYVAQILYEDIGALFGIGDHEGALVSLERLLTVAPLTPQIEVFIEQNEQKLLGYYESTLGPWTRVATLRHEPTGMPASYFQFDKVASVVRHLDGVQPLSEAIARSGLRPIEACAVLSQLSRSASLHLSQKG